MSPKNFFNFVCAVLALFVFSAQISAQTDERNRSATETARRQTTMATSSWYPPDRSRTRDSIRAGMS